MPIYQDSALVNGVVPIASGGTGSTTQNFVDLTTAQISINGIKNFNGNIGFGVANPLNKLHIGVPFVANTGGIRLPITSSTAPQVGQPIGVNASGDVVRLAPVTFDATVSFSTLTPTTIGVVFTPNTPASTTVLYVSSVNGSQWTYDGTTYVTQPALGGWSTTGNASTSPTANFIGTTDAVGFNIRTSNTNRITIGGGGNVGIGVSPNARLHIGGDVLATTDNTSMCLDTTSVARLGFVKKIGAIPVIATDSVNHIIFSKSDQVGVNVNVATAVFTELMRIQNTGNVGIGTATPNVKLDVNGSVRATGIVNYNTTALAIADATLLTGTFYTVTTGGAKQLFVK